MTVADTDNNRRKAAHKYQVKKTLNGNKNTFEGESHELEKK